MFLDAFRLVGLTAFGLGAGLDFGDFGPGGDDTALVGVGALAAGVEGNGAGGGVGVEIVAEEAELEGPGWMRGFFF